MSRTTYKIALMSGDGIGPEIVAEARKVLDTVASKFGFVLQYEPAPCGDDAKKNLGSSVPESSVRVFETSDACLKGPVGETVMDVNRKFRFEHDLYANVRPAKSYPEICPPALRPDIDLVVIRENTEGFYRAIESEVVQGVWTTTGVYTVSSCRRIARFAFDYARRRLNEGQGKGMVSHVHKANIFRNSHGMFLRICREEAKKYPDLKFNDFYADAFCALLVREPHRFDVVLAENLIADLLSDLAGQIAGGLGMTAATNMNYERKLAYFEPTHGCAPDIAGTGSANPLGQILSAALMLEFLGTVHNDPRCLSASEEIDKALTRYLTTSRKEDLPVELGGKARTSDVGNAVITLLR